VFAADQRSGRRLGLWWLPVVGQELVDPRRRVRLHAEEDVGEVGDRVHPVHLAGRDERVEAGQVLAGFVRPDEEEVLPSEGGDAERPLGGVMPRP
jgi:hypothetical protein